MYAQMQQIESPHNFKVVRSRNTSGPKYDRNNQLRLPLSEGETNDVFYKRQFYTFTRLIHNLIFISLFKMLDGLMA